MDNIDANITAVEKVLEGKRTESDRVDICIKGVVLGFPAALEAFTPHFPFGLNYIIETKIVDDPSEEEEEEPLKITFTPRIARGFFARFFRLLFFEPKGQSVGDAKIDEAFVCTYSDRDEAKRFCRYPGVADRLISLLQTAKFTDLLVKADAGLFLAQPLSFDHIDVEQCGDTFRLLGELGQVIFDEFS